MKTKILETLANIVSEVCDVDPVDLRSVSRKTELIEARSIFVWQANRCGISANEIAKFINKKNSGSIYCYLAKYRYFKNSSLSFRLCALQVNKKIQDNSILTIS